MRFDEIGLPDEVLQGIEAMNYQEMTPVQEQTIPVLLEGRDLIGCAQTGTGKTAAYILPLLCRLQQNGNPDNRVKSLIVVPTRELAQQIDVQLQGFSYFLPVSTTVVHGSGGGIEWSWQRIGMEQGADVVIATPGRLLAHIETSKVDLSGVEYFILDEADRMLDMGFMDDINRIIKELPEKKQTAMFSATLPPKIRELARKILHNPAEVTIAVSKPNEAIEQSAYICHESQKIEIIRELFSTPTGTKTIIFASSKLRVKELAFTLKRMKLNVAAMHSDLEQSKREEVMLDFKNGKIDILVATDVVARGIDIEDIGTVVNFEVPRDTESYIHRIGRTARASAEGSAITLVGEREQGKFRQIEQFIGREITKNPLPERLGSGPGYNPGDKSHDRERGHGRSGSGSGSGSRSGSGSGKGGRKGGRPGRGEKKAPRIYGGPPAEGAAEAGQAGHSGQTVHAGQPGHTGHASHSIPAGSTAQTAPQAHDGTPADAGATKKRKSKRRFWGSKKGPEQA